MIVWSQYENRSSLSKGYEMERIKVFRLAIVFLVLLLTMGIGSRLLLGPAFVNARNLIKYKVVSTGAANTVYEYEKVLNGTF